LPRPFFLVMKRTGRAGFRAPASATSGRPGEHGHEGDDRTRNAAEEPQPRSVGGRAAEHHPHPVERAARGERRRHDPADGDRSRPADRRIGRGRGGSGRRDDGFGAHPVRHRPQAARGQPGRAGCRRRQDAGECRTRAIQPVDAAARRLPGDRRGRAADEIRAAGTDAAPDHRQDPLRDLHRGESSCTCRTNRSRC
jgi:hypothetical protein